MRVIILLAAAWSVLNAGPARAQATAVDRPSTAGFRSGGINAVITNSSIKDRVVVIQFLIQNTRADPIYIRPVTSGDVGAAAMSSRGTAYHIRAVSGMTTCTLNNNNLNDNVARCMKDDRIESMTFVGPNETTVLAVRYERSNRDGSGRRISDDASDDSVSFALKFLVRSAPKGADGLMDGSQRAGPVGVITISFPLVPLKTV